MWGIFPNPLTPGGVAERRGNGLQSRLHGFKSRLHLQGRLAQRESASLTRKRSLVQSQYRPLDLRVLVLGPNPARLAQRESASLTRKRSLVQSQYRARSTSSERGPSPVPCAISSAGERFPDTEEVTGSIPVSRTSRSPRPSRTVGGFVVP